MHSCAPTLFQDAIHYLSTKELAFLHRGPTYVSPCQLHDLSSSIIFDQALTQHLTPLQQQLTKLFTKYHVDIARRWRFEEEIQTQFIRSFSVPIPTAIKERALNEQELIRSIQFQLQQDHLILRRTADDQNMYYVGERDEFYRMANEFMDNALCYQCIAVIDDQNNNSEQQHLHEIIHSIDSSLEKLQQNRIITKDHLAKMQTNKKIKIYLPHLYFLPETHQNGHVTLQPRFSSSSSSGQYPIQPLATYLDQLLRPLYEKFSQSTTFHSGTDFIQKLQHYCGQSNQLLPATNFITFQIHHLHRRVSHDDLLIALNRFLQHPVVQGRYERLTTDAIEQLVALVLHHHIFIYNGKIYRHIKGGPLNVPLIELLGNIYLHHWQLPLVSEVRLANQFYGHYHQMGFLTWHGSREKLNTCFSELNRQHPDISITISVGLHVHFLNVDIENRHGNLYTCVYHDPNQQPFLLPYAINHPRLLHRQWVRFALLRAGQYCSSWEDFHDERIYIELTCLTNGYSLDFVEYHIQQFFVRFNPVDRRMTLNRWTYPSFRTRLFTYIHEQEKDAIEQQQLKISRRFIELYYLFDWGSRCEFNEKFYRLWWMILEADPYFKKFGLKVKLISKHCYPSNTFFFLP